MLEDSARRAVEAAGFVPAAEGAVPDVSVQIGARVTATELSPWTDPFWYGPYGWGYGGGFAGGSATTTVRDILIGTLVVDMADAQKKQVVWRGMGVKEVDTGANPEKRDKSINNAVKKIFKNYPPKVKK